MVCVLLLGHLPVQRGDLALEFVVLFLDLAHGRGQILGTAVQFTCQDRKRVEALLDQVLGVASCNDFEAADAGGDTAFADGSEAADLGRGGDVCAAAEFHAHVLVFAEADHSHFVPVFLAEKGHSALGDSPIV